MPRYFIRLSFNGRKYHGWQVQENANTVQAELNSALVTLTRQSIETTGCGRTDAGVHAREFFVHVDLQDAVHEDDFVRHLNGILPADIAVSGMKKVEPAAHARFDATSRTYEYHLYHHKDPFLRYTAAFHPHSLDYARMNEMAQHLLKQEDFASFSKSNTQVFTTKCRIKSAAWATKEHASVFTIEANRFLRNMVRAIVGTLVLAGENKIGEKEFLEIMSSGDRKQAGMSMPACGLHLVRIQYPYETP